MNPIGYLIAPCFFIVAIGAGALALTVAVNVLSGNTPQAAEGVD
ncbi:hypothetical protein KU6B_19140 [Mameliella alba]|nr:MULTISPECIES: hypothetical protein [Mameliella]MDD9731406.1 hypothetical protein [Mameliella sp. AT18]BBU55649.1 hypothetical protein KU6B_19140 [Mameliella alba]